MQLADLGEFGLIRRIERRVARTRPRRASVALGIGDDAALLRLRAGEVVAVSSDAMVEEVHFRRATERPSAVGRRAAVAALSDLAAMGARPLGLCVALQAPAATEVRWLDAWLGGLLATAQQYGAPLVGGNVARARQLSFTLTALGGVATRKALRRDAARPGDTVYVTGVLGRSALDLARVEAGGGWRRHIPQPRLEAGQRLARSRWVGACIDLSDGLISDLGHVLRASRVGATLDPDRVPRPRGFRRHCRALGRDPEALLFGGGEDYELLFTARVGAPGEAELGHRLGVPVSAIGQITRRRGVRGVRAQGFTHF